IVIIGRTSDPPSIVVPIDASSLTASDVAVTAGSACLAGAECVVPPLGACDDVQGTVVQIAGGGCGCEITDPDPSCIGCGGGASGQCGGACEFAVNDSTARGTCLPFDY